MGIFKFLFTGLVYVGYIGNLLYFLFIEYSLIIDNWTNIINPLTHFRVAWIMVTSWLFWIFLACIVIGVFARAGVDKIEEGM